MSRPNDRQPPGLSGATHHIAAAGLTCLVLCLPAGCVQEMANQPRVDTYETAAFFADGLSVRPPVEGTIARGELPGDETLETGEHDGTLVEKTPLPVTRTLLQRGQERFGIYCSHCHGPAGYGDGMVVQRGFPAPPSLHISRLREAPDGHVFRTITNGHGRMPAFGRRIAVRDRWAITGWVRTLQLSQHAPLSRLSADDRAALDSGETPGSGQTEPAESGPAESGPAESDQTESGRTGADQTSAEPEVTPQ